MPHARRLITRTRLGDALAVVARGSGIAWREVAGRLSNGGRRDWAAELEVVLRENILPFWIRHAVDREHGGVHTWLDRRGVPIRPGTKHIVPTARVAWSFAAAYRRLPRSESPAEPRSDYRRIAEHTLAFMRDRMWDARHGGFHWCVDRRGRLVDDRKHVYGQCFAIYALAEYARAFDDGAARSQALEVFGLMERHAHDDANGSYRPVFSADWHRELDGDAFLGAAGGKHQCGQIALLEALMSLYAATGNAGVGARLEEVLDLTLDRLIDPHHGHTRVHVTQDWKPIGRNVASHGHDIKLSWLLIRAAKVLGRAADPAVRRAALRLARHTIRHGFDRRRGGVALEGVPSGPVTASRKIFWAQAEALVGFLNAYELTGERAWIDAFARQARFTLDRFVDHRHGEWFELGDPVSQVTRPKVSPWKSCYHHSRACLEAIERLGGHGDGEDREVGVGADREVGDGADREVGDGAESEAGGGPDEPPLAEHPLLESAS